MQLFLRYQHSDIEKNLNFLMFEKNYSLDFSAAAADKLKVRSHRRRDGENFKKFSAAAADQQKIQTRRRRDTRNLKKFQPPPPIDSSAYTSKCTTRFCIFFGIFCNCIMGRSWSN